LRLCFAEHTLRKTEQSHSKAIVMLNTLHITNGDGTADIIKQSRLEGDTLPWRDTMHYGPFPSELELDDVSMIRAAYFGGDSEEGRLEAERDFTLRNEHLKASARYQEVVLWYEHDLLDQLQILQLLDWFGQHRDQLNKLSIICINQFEGIDPFRGIGQLNCEQMASLFDDRLPISEEQMSLARRGWEAFRSSNPTDLEAFIQSNNLQSLPFLHKALTRHLLEYPHTSDGLTQTERQILTIIANGTQKPGQVFNENMGMETALFIGDWASYRIIGELCNREQPLLCCESGEMFYHPLVVNIPRDEFIKQRLKITPLGEQVLSGQRTAIDIIQRDIWLGGAHINTHKSMWMWNTVDQKIVLKAS